MDSENKRADNPDIKSGFQRLVDFVKSNLHSINPAQGKKAKLALKAYRGSADNLTPDSNKGKKIDRAA